jgi:hypothetical protein
VSKLSGKTSLVLFKRFVVFFQGSVDVKVLPDQEEKHKK